MSEETAPAQVPGQQEVRLVDIEVINDNVALNLMVSFLNIAQKRGAFNLDEASKVWECIKQFIIKDAPANVPTGEPSA